MTSYELGFDFQKIKTATILKKSNGLLFPVLILFPTFFCIFLVFLGLYIFKVPIDINDVSRSFGESEYQEFFMIFLTIMGTLSFLHVLVFLKVFLQKPKPCLYITTGMDADPVMYSVSKKKHVYIDDSQMLSLYLLSSVVDRTTEHLAIEKAKHEILFWTGLEYIKDFKIKKGVNRTKLTYLDPFVSEKKTYTLSFDESGNLKKFSELIMSWNYGNHQLKSMNTYHIHDINQTQRLPINPLIQAKLVE